MNIKLKTYCCLSLCMLICLIPSISFADDANIAVTIFSSTYYGTYSGNTENGSPIGEGIFICTDGYSDFSLTGTWENTLLNGEATIQYGDGFYIQATYKDGLISGNVTEYYANGSYRKYSCSEGRPNGLITYYDSENNITKFDYFYQMKTISDLKKSCTAAEHSLLLNKASGITPYKISGTVLGTFDDNTYAYILMQDAENHLYVGTYRNKTSNKFNQAIVPNLVTGDYVTAYGFLQKQDSLSNIDDLYISMPITEHIISNETPTEAEKVWHSSLDIKDFLTQDVTLPFITLFSADTTDSENFDRQNPSNEYKDIVRNPYLYTDLKCILNGIVTKARINYSNNTVMINMQENDTGNEYFVRYSFSEGDALPSIGDTISVKGTYRGNDKYLYNEEADSDGQSGTYIIYPRIHTSSVNIE